MYDFGLTALIPAYKPSADILPMLAERLVSFGFKTVIVDDGSGEDCKDIFERSSKYATVLRHDKNMGKGRALKTGLEYIKDHFPENTVIVTLDADGQHSPEDAERIAHCAAVTSGSLVLGSRSFKGMPPKSRIGNTLTKFVYRLTTGKTVNDTQTGLRAFCGGMIPFMLRISGERYEYEMNVLLECSKNGIPILERSIETVYYDNNAGSHFDPVKDSFLVYREILKFAASSFTGFIVDYGLYFLLTVLTRGLGTKLSVPLSNITARVVSASVNFAINRRFVFKSSDSVAKTAAEYFALAALILAGNTLLLSALTVNLGMNKYIAKLLTEIMFFVLSWLAQKYVIFRKERSGEKSR